MVRSSRRFALVLASAAMFVLVAPAAFAQEDGGVGAEDQVVLTGRLVVPEGETVGTAVIFDGDAVIAGTVLETLVVFNGRVEITGAVDGDVVVFNGRVFVRSGAEVGGDIVGRRATQIEDGATVGGSVKGLATRFDLRDLAIGRFAWWLGYTVSTVVLGLVLLFLAPGLDGASVRLRDRTGAVIGFGLGIFVALPIVAVLLFVTIVGIPLALFLVLALALLYSIGYVIGALAIGRLVLAPPRSRYAAFLAAWGALRVIALVPFLGGLAWLVATVVGLGTLWVAARRVPGRVTPVMTPSPPPPPALA